MPFKYSISSRLEWEQKMGKLDNYLLSGLNFLLNHTCTTLYSYWLLHLSLCILSNLFVIFLQFVNVSIHKLYVTSIFILFLYHKGWLPHVPHTHMYRSLFELFNFYNKDMFRCVENCRKKICHFFFKWMPFACNKIIALISLRSVL